MSFIPKPYEIYKHFKGNLYQIIAVAEHSETGEQLVVYQALYGDFRIYARPLSMFTEKVDREKYPDAAQEYRFELQNRESLRENSDSEKRKPTAQAENVDGASKACDVENTGEYISEAAVEPKATEASPESPVSEPSEEECTLDPMVIEFLDADNYEQKLNILAGLHHRITDEMITTMAISCDIEVNEGDVEERYAALRNCLLTMEKFECNRLR